MTPTSDAPCDDAEVMRLWRECGLPEYFLGTAGTNHKLLAFAKCFAARRAAFLIEVSRTPMQSSRTGRVRDWLITWLTERESDTLPRLIQIANECPLTNSYYDVDNALRWLRYRSKIAWRSGTRSENRGHSAIRIIATGRVLKTAGCPFEPPA